MKIKRSIVMFLTCFSICMLTGFAQTEESWSQLMADFQRFYRDGKYIEALPVVERAVRISRDFQQTDERIVDSLNGLSRTLHLLGRYDEALKIYNEVLERVLDLRKGQLPSTALLLNICRMHVEKGEFNKAREFIHRAIDNDEIRYGSNDPALGTDWAELADTYLRQGRHLEALPHAERGLALVASRRRRSPDRLRPLMVVGHVRMALRQFDEAEPLLQEVIEITEAQYGWSTRARRMPLRVWQICGS
jgi:tetratricopeptide (TPR) repeat protein